MPIINGIDTDKLKHPTGDYKTIPMVKGRVVHIDADFLAYYVSWDENKSLQEMKHNTDVTIEKVLKQTGAQDYILHLTGKNSTKGDRYKLALLKEYQANRKGKPKPKFLYPIKEWMHKERGAILHMEQEADDGMSIAQYKAVADGKKNLSVIATADKDLQMCPGLLFNWDSEELTDSDEFGYLVLDESKTQKKIRGRGWIYFWAQMLTGDPADTISGLPKVCLDEYCPTGKYKACGAVMAYNILKDVKTNKEAFKIVRGLYKEYGYKEGFVDYRDGKAIKFGDAFISEASLLWMRRNPHSGDVINWMKEHCV